jgi:predicted RNA-binding Zn-ribbon protein involved in translation (DUF1610 family)
MVIPVRREDMEMTPSTATSERQQSDKVTLYCPECGHESRINGDWLIHVLADSLIYECPDCGVVIDSRQDQEVLTERSGGSLHFAAGN